MTKAVTLAQIAGTIIASLAGKAASSHTHAPAEITASAEIGVLLASANAQAGRRALSTMGVPDCVFTHRVASGANSGSSITALTWGTRPLNTTVVNTLAGASLASNQVTLPAGTYYFEYAGEIYGTNGKNRLYNVTDASEIALGMNASNRAATGAGIGQVAGSFTIGTSKVLRFEIRCFDAGDRCGTNGGVGVDEIYAIAKFWKIA